MALTEKQQKVKAHIYEEGKSQKEAAALAGVSEKSVGKWVKKFDWNKLLENCIGKASTEELIANLTAPVLTNQMRVKKAQVKTLIEEKGYNQKQAAAVVGVSEKTVGNWMNEKEEISLDAFLSHLNNTNESLYKEVFVSLQQYRKRLLASL